MNMLNTTGVQYLPGSTCLHFNTLRAMTQFSTTHSHLNRWENLFAFCFSIAA